MERNLFILILFYIVCGCCTNAYSQIDFRKNQNPQNQNKKIRAYSYPIGTIKPNEIVGDSSKTYKFDIPKFQKATRLIILYSDYEGKDNKLADYRLFAQDFKQGATASSAVIINEIDKKYFFAVPGVSIGQLNFPLNNDESVKYFQIKAKTKSNSVFLFYIDNKDNRIEKKITNNKQPLEIKSDADLNRILPYLNRFYVFHYIEEQI